MIVLKAHMNVAESLTRVRGKVLQALRVYEALDIEVGVFEGGEPRKDGGPSNVQLGGMFEYGTSRMPQRSWLRAWSLERASAIIENAEKAMRILSRGGVAAAQSALGAWSAGDIKARIARRIPPPNAPSTVKRKGSSTPLIDTGDFRSAITWRRAGK